MLQIRGEAVVSYHQPLARQEMRYPRLSRRLTYFVGLTYIVGLTYFVGLTYIVGLTYFVGLTDFVGLTYFVDVAYFVGLTYFVDITYIVGVNKPAIFVLSIDLTNGYLIWRLL